MRAQVAHTSWQHVGRFVALHPICVGPTSAGSPRQAMDVGTERSFPQLEDLEFQGMCMPFPCVGLDRPWS